MLAIGKQLTTEQRLSKAVVDIMGNPKYVALAGILMIGDKRICDTTPTAYTNGRDEVYGREFVDKLSDAEFRFLILHECYHKLYRHLTTWHHLYKENPQLANVACDYVINLKIADDNKDDSFATMTGALTVGCYDEQYRGMDSAQVYEMLKQEGGSSSNTSTGPAQVMVHQVTRYHKASMSMIGRAHKNSQPMSNVTLRVTLTRLYVRAR